MCWLDPSPLRRWCVESSVNGMPVELIGKRSACNFYGGGRGTRRAEQAAHSGRSRRVPKKTLASLGMEMMLALSENLHSDGGNGYSRRVTTDSSTSLEILCRRLVHGFLQVNAWNRSVGHDFECVRPFSFWPHRERLFSIRRDPASAVLVARFSR